jgi:alpha,alpha-trehalose phosphorylase
VWTALVAGFGGMRDHYGELSFDPRLPKDWPSLSFPLHWQGTPLKIEITAEQLRWMPAPASRSPSRCAARRSSSAESTLTVPLRGQGPELSGRPTISDIGDALREDGTLLSASVPTMTTSIPVITGSIPIVGAMPGDDANLGIDS